MNRLMRPQIIFFRLLYIAWVLARYNLVEILSSVPQPWRTLVRLFQLVTWPLRPRGDQASLGKRLTLALERLGPLFIKLGQLLSTRRDLLPEEVSRELMRLREHVKPFSYAEVQQVIQKSFGRSIEDCFSEFSREPIASASIAQVHSARLKPVSQASGDQADTVGEQLVAVKVLRPRIRQVVARDLYLLNFLFSLVERNFKHYHHLNLPDIARELEKILSCETDLRVEAANCAVLRRQSLASKLLYIPQVYWDYVRADVMVMEKIQGIAIDNLDQLRAAGVDLRQLAHRGIDLFIEQVFDQELFHADMHPGNIFVDVSDPRQPTFIAVDFGMVGSLNNHDKSYLARNLLAFFKRDYAQVARLHAASRWLLQDQNNLHDFATELRNMCEPIFEKSSKDISFSDLLQRLFVIARRFEIQIQPQLLLLQKTFINVEGIGRYLYPELNLWVTSRQRIEKWVARQLSVRHNSALLRKNLEDLLWSMPDVTRLLQIGSGKLASALESVEHINQNANRLRRKQSQWRGSRWFFGIGCVLWLCATLAYLFPVEGQTLYYNLPWMSWLGYGFGTLALLLSWPGRGDDESRSSTHRRPPSSLS